MSFALPSLPYSYNALEPYIDARTMEVHHTKHHQKYTDKLNEAVAGHPNVGNLAIEDILSDLSSLPQEIQTPVRNHGGGYANHNFFWTILAPAQRQKPEGDMAAALDTTFGTFSDFKQKFSDAATSLFGSGWTWLVMDEDRQLKITSTFNQDSPLSLGLKPLLGIDLWEHAYYLKY